MFTGMRVESRGSPGSGCCGQAGDIHTGAATSYSPEAPAGVQVIPGRMNNEGISLSCTHINSHEDEEEEEDDFIYVPCKCLGQEVKVLIDTGCKLNLMSSRTVERLCLKDLLEENKMEVDVFPFQRKLCVDGHIRELSLTLGKLRVMCPFFILESNRPLMSLGNKTLQSLKCVIDTEKQMLLFGTVVREQLHFAKQPFNER
ncbi:hypothetical protein KUCAC02_021940 [Chaenocephalus aceratus]|uniref:Uncharacterized protein n=1 Tax=Chaenocephalus aceratus TaxID=36190 RepID=A0ACB9XJ83_CHAAC|nr:hypothetical protein KUCAC02_021940 [Chaenocephalus aceratus]